ncbi:MAG: polysaccharide biosynthesis/export family protein, partial [Cyclobacteriaceae bacterium]|nr:polysaccharide biosynthesis/export family protein [Cyclobacteriaceae bacterium]
PQKKTLNKLLYLLLALSVLSSCVPNRRLVYLQHTSEPKTDEVKNADNVVRNYNTHYKEYELQPGDIISLRVASITPEEFNFVKQYEGQLGTIRSLNQYNQGNQGSRGQGAMQGGMGSSTTGGQQGSTGLYNGFVLDSAGMLELPYVGVVELGGRTIAEAEKSLRDSLTGFMETPVVRLQLLNFHFTIMGEVKEEGRYTAYNPNIHIFDALTMAGNLSEFADRSNIKVVRFKDRVAQVLYLNTLEEDMLGEENFYLHPNDLIIVPPLKAKETKQYTWPVYSGVLGLITSTVSIVLLAISLSK